MGNDKKSVTPDLAQAFVQTASDAYGKEGELEIDVPGIDDAMSHISTSAESIESLKENGGVYVKAWVWVPVESLPEGVRAKFGLDSED